MTTKHVPATPLPWIVNQRKHVCAASTGFADVATTADGRKTQTAVDDAAYIAHTANAYPGLVERVNRVAHWQPSVDDERLAVSAIDREIYAARALLRELGELK